MKVSAVQLPLPPPHTPLVQVSPVVQELPSSHPVPSGARRSGGQAVALPSQLSATSHVEAPRHSVPAVATTSVGHVELDPVQFSATSQSPATPRHSLVFGRKVSTG